jgi:hypothetical protein
MECNNKECPRNDGGKCEHKYIVDKSMICISVR